MIWEFRDLGIKKFYPFKFIDFILQSLNTSMPKSLNKAPI
jgi:hypothetical protein